MLKMTMKDWGGACSSFGRNIGWDGNEISQIFEYKTVGLTLDQTKVIFNLQDPDYIKLDVDGIEHFILKGGLNVLKKVKSVLFRFIGTSMIYNLR